MVRNGTSLEAAHASVKELIAGKLKYLVPMTIIFIVSYIGLTVFAGFAKDLMGTKIVGSINLAPGSFDSRRELAIEVRDDDVVERLTKIAHHDWEHSHPLDLTDEGLLAEFEKHKTKGAEELALHGDHEKR